MEHICPESIKVVADSLGISNLEDEVAQAMAPDVEYRLREIIQEGLKFMHHSKRSILTTEDINSGLRLRSVEPLYGFASAEPMQFSRPEGHRDVFFIADEEVSFDEVINAPLNKCPVETNCIPHWLAIDGVQPAIPENPVA
eukprot:gene29811-37180_t